VLSPMAPGKFSLRRYAAEKERGPLPAPAQYLMSVPTASQEGPWQAGAWQEGA